jgi:hypothetical protein
VSEQARVEPEAALVSAQPATLELLLPPGESTSHLKPRWRQIGGSVTSPLELTCEWLTHPVDARISLLRVTPPTVTRVTRLQLFVGQFGPVGVVVIPSGEPRVDLASLPEALAASRMRLVVCGRAPGLREFLSTHRLDFEDEGNEPPRQLAPDTLLIGELTANDWDRLARAPRTGGHLLAFIEAPALVPGVYAQRDATTRRHRVKITLPITPLLSTDPRARETLHTLLLQVLEPAQP